MVIEERSIGSFFSLFWGGGGGGQKMITFFFLSRIDSMFSKGLF